MTGSSAHSPARRPALSPPLDATVGFGGAPQWARGPDCVHPTSSGSTGLGIHPTPNRSTGVPGSLARLEQTAACVQVGPHLAAWLIFCCLFVSLADVCPSETSSNWGWCVRGAVLQFCASHFWKVCWRFKQTTRVTGQIWALKHTGSNEKKQAM